MQFRFHKYGFEFNDTEYQKIMFHLSLSMIRLYLGIPYILGVSYGLFFKGLKPFYSVWTAKKYEYNSLLNTDPGVHDRNFIKKILDA